MCKASTASKSGKIGKRELHFAWPLQSTRVHARVDELLERSYSRFYPRCSTPLPLLSPTTFQLHLFGLLRHTQTRLSQTSSARRTRPRQELWTRQRHRDPMDASLKYTVRLKQGLFRRRQILERTARSMSVRNHTSARGLRCWIGTDGTFSSGSTHR